MWQTREAGHGGHCVGSGLRSGDKGGRWAGAGSLLQLTCPAGLCLGRAEITASPSFLLGHCS